MDAKTTKTLKIKIKENDIEPFKSAIKKLKDSFEIAGFKNTIPLTEEEVKVIKELSKKID